MTDYEATAKLEQLARDEAFMNEFLSCETPEAAQAALKEKGVDVSLEQITALGQALAADGSAELSEDQLANVSGGSFISVLAPLYTVHLAGKTAKNVYKWLKTW